MVAVDADGNPVVPPAGQRNVTIVPEDLIEQLMRVLGSGAQDLHTMTAGLKHRPDPGRFGGSPKGRQLATLVDGAYDDLLAAISDAVTGLQNYRTGLGVYRDGMRDADTDVKAKAHRQAANLAAAPSLTAGDGCLDDSASTACTVAPEGGTDEG